MPLSLLALTHENMATSFSRPCKEDEKICLYPSTSYFPELEPNKRKKSPQRTQFFLIGKLHTTNGF